MSKVILIAGRKRSGKDTFGTLLKDAYTSNGLTAELMSFATPMKQILATTLGITVDKLNILKDIPENPHRGYLQRLGTEGMKPLFGNDVWTNLAKKAVGESTADVIIFTDFRFPEENVFDSTTIRVTRGNLVNDSNDAHISERALNGFTYDYIVKNNSTIHDLACEAGRITNET